MLKLMFKKNKKIKKLVIYKLLFFLQTIVQKFNIK